MGKDASKHNGQTHHPFHADDSERDPIERLADEFAQRHRSGERVTVEAYARRYPEYADEIRDLFPSVIAMEHLRYSKRSRQAASSPAPEQLGDFRIVGEIARGGMGVVYEAEQVTLGRRVAVKVLPQQMLRSRRDVQRFEREAQTAAKLHHTNIVPVFGVGEHDGLHYIVMQLIQGVGLDEILREMKCLLDEENDDSPSSQTASRTSHVKRSAFTLLHKTLRPDASTASHGGVATPRVAWRSEEVGSQAPTTRPLAETSSVTTSDPPTARLTSRVRAQISEDFYRNVAKIGLQAASALSYAHKHDTLHRDVKPGNLLLDDEGVVWMADFGLAKAMESTDVTWTGDVVGTLAYLAPERLEGKACPQSDIYSLGLTLYELLTFQRAFDGRDRVQLMNRIANEELPSPRKLNPTVPRDLETIVLKAAARSPTDRYQTAAALADDLESFLADRPIHARRVSAVERVYRWCRRNRTLAAVTATAGLLLISLATAGYFRESALRRRAEDTSLLAVKALDEIYGQFAPRQFTVPVVEPLDNTDDEVLLANGELPLSQDVALLLENLLRFYDDLARQADNQSLAIKSVSANRRVGDIRQRLGQFDEARATYEKAIQRVENLSESVRRSRPVRLEYARVQNGLGMVLREQHEYEAMIEAHQEALRSLGTDSLTSQEEFERARTLYLSHIARDSGHRRNRRDRKRSRDSEREIRQAVDILKSLCDQHPDVHDYQFLLARCYLVLKSHCNSDGSLNQHQARAIQMLEHLVETSPDVADYRYELGDAYRAIEWREHSRRRDGKPRTDEAATSVKRLRRALAITADLEIQHPNIPQYCQLSKQLHYLLAEILTESGQLQQAEQQYQQAIHRQQLIMHQSRNPQGHQMWLLSLQLSHAQLLRDMGQVRQSKENLQQIVAGLEGLSGDPEIKQSDFRRRVTEKTLSRAYATLASVLNRLGEESAAESVLRKAEGPCSR